jgi:hypothetical protein
MKTFHFIALVAAALLSGCITTTKRGEYRVNVGKAEERSIEVGGQFNASAFVKWSETRYGEEPKALVLLVVASLLPDASSGSYEVGNIRFTRYEAGNYIGWGAIVTGSADVLRNLKLKSGMEIEGDFSFEEARLLQVRREGKFPR